MNDILSQGLDVDEVEELEGMALVPNNRWANRNRPPRAPRPRRGGQRARAPAGQQQRQSRQQRAQSVDSTRSVS
jgi:hypothetical protein